MGFCGRGKRQGKALLLTVGRAASPLLLSLRSGSVLWGPFIHDNLICLGVLFLWFGFGVFFPPDCMSGSN